MTHLAGLFHAPWMLLGLAVLVIPPLVHLLNRRRHDTIDWGAMQFLQVSDAVRRRMLLEEILLMLLRMGLLAVLVLALAGPFLDVNLPVALSARDNRDVVLVIDGSASMAATAEGEEASPAAKAKGWAARFLNDLGPGDAVSIVLAREQAVNVSGTPSADLDRARRLISSLPEPAGACDWAEAIRAAHALLAPGQNRRREIILLTDNQKNGLADPASLFRLELLASELGLNLPEPKDRPRPMMRMIDLAAGRSGSLPNYALAPLRSNRPVAVIDREVRFQGDLVLGGQESYVPPHKLRLEVDGKYVLDLPSPRFAGKDVPRDGRIPFRFSHRFRTAGTHLVSVIVEPDPPAAERPPGYVVRDRVPGDNRQDLSVEVVPSLPVLIVEGGLKPTPFLRDALSPARDRTPAVQARVVPVQDFAPAMLEGQRAVILHDVARLTEEQAEALASHVASGGGVLVLPGERSDAAWYNASLYRGGEGWLPARLDGLTGDESKRDAARLEPESFTHPALDLFRDKPAGGLSDARFPRWWKLSTPGKHSAATQAGQLRTSEGKTPFLVERSYLAGRALVCAVPLDASFGSNLTDLPAFVPLVHELVAYLAGANSAEFNLAPGQPIKVRLEPGTVLGQYTLAAPGGEARPLTTQPGEAKMQYVQRIERPGGEVLVIDRAKESGVYTLQVPGKGAVYYVVPPSVHEASLEPLNDGDRTKVSRLTGIRFTTGDAEDGLSVRVNETQRQDVWSWMLLGFVGLLCVEVWMTRRLVMNR